jgi:NADH-quinone oxidoreductase subunit N
MQTLIVVFITAILAMFLGFSKNKNIVKYISILGLASALCVNFMGLNKNVFEFSFFFEFNTSSLFLSNIAIIITLLIFIISGYKKEQYAWNDFYPLILFSLCGAIILFSFTHLLTMFLGLEILSIPLYVLAASNKENGFSLEAGLKYFILGAFSTGIMLFGIALIYGAMGSLELLRISELQQFNMLQIPFFFQVGIVLLLVSILFKIAVVPFHFWTPDVYSGSPVLVTAFMGAIVKMAAANTLIYLLKGFFIFQFDSWQKYLTISILLSFTFANFAALVQKNVKRMFAFSSISHSGFILLSIIASVYTQSPFVTFYYVIGYVLVSTGIFAIIAYLSEKTEATGFEMFDGLAKKEPILAFAMTVFLMSMAGIPLTVGFIGKYSILVSTFSFNMLLFVFALLASALSIAYYLKVINRMFMKEAVSFETIETKSGLFFSVIFILLITFAFAIFPETVSQILSKALFY